LKNVEIQKYLEELGQKRNEQLDFEAVDVVNEIKKIASMLSRFNVPISKRNDIEVDSDNQIITHMQFMEQICTGFELPLKSNYRKECLKVLNDVIEKKYKGESRKLKL